MTSENSYASDEDQVVHVDSPKPKTISKIKIVESKLRPFNEHEYDITRYPEVLAKLSKKEALKELSALQDKGEHTLFMRGGVLSLIRKNKYYEPAPSFAKWIETETAMSYSTAHALAQTYEAIMKAGLTAQQVKMVGWTKLRAIASRIDENPEHWIALAQQHSKTKLSQLVRDQQAASDSEAVKKSTVGIAKSYKLSKKQTQVVEKAIEAAKKHVSVEADGEALEHICAEYVSSKEVDQKLLELDEENLTLTIAGVLDKLNSEVATRVVRNVFASTNHEIESEE